MATAKSKRPKGKAKRGRPEKVIPGIPDSFENVLKAVVKPRGDTKA